MRPFKLFDSSWVDLDHILEIGPVSTFSDSVVSVGFVIQYAFRSDGVRHSRDIHFPSDWDSDAPEDVNEQKLNLQIANAMKGMDLSRSDLVAAWRDKWTRTSHGL
jgi:hypothetical protein